MGLRRVRKPVRGRQARRIILDELEPRIVLSRLTTDSAFMGPLPSSSVAAYATIAPASIATIADTPWIPIGPNSATVFAMQVDPFNGGTLFAGTYFGGLYRSYDGGLSWSQVTADFSNDSVFTIALDPASSGHLYVGTFNHGVYGSTDGGQSWKALNQGLTTTSVQDLAIDPENSSTLLAATYSGIFRTTNGGLTWAPAAIEPANFHAQVLRFDPSTPGVVYAGTSDNGIYRSTDGGKSWEQFNSGMGEVAVTSLELNPAAAGGIYAGTTTGVFALAPTGSTWTELTYDLPNAIINEVTPDGHGGLFAATNLGVYQFDGTSHWTQWKPTPTRIVLSNPSLSLIYVAGTYKTLEVTKDGGKTFSENDQGIQNVFMGAIATTNANGQTVIYAGTDGGVQFTSSYFKTGTTWPWIDGLDTDSTVFGLTPDPNHPGTLYAATERGGLWRTTDYGSTWDDISTGIVPSLILSISQASTGSKTLYIGTNEGLYVSRDGGLTWSDTSNRASIPSVTSVLADPVRPGVAYFGTQSGQIYRTIDDGQTFQLMWSGTPSDSISQLSAGPYSKLYAVTVSGQLFASDDLGVSFFPTGSDIKSPVLDVAVDPTKPWIAYAATSGGGLYKTVSDSIAWQAVNTGIDIPYSFSVVIDPNSPSTIYAGSVGRTYKSLDGGQTWKGFATGLPPSGYVTNLIINPTNSQILYATVEGMGVYKSVDGGTTWAALDGGSSLAKDLSIALSTTDPSIVYAGTQFTGFERSTDGGATWTPRNQGMSLVVRAIAVDPSNPQNLYAGSLNSGMFRSTDGGNAWSNVGLGDRNIFGVQVGTNGIVAATATGVALSTDNGTTWGDLGQRTTYVYSMVTDPTNLSTIYVGGIGGQMFKSLDAGKSWTTIGQSLPHRNILAMAIDASTGTLFASPEGQGVYRSPDGGLTWTQSDNQILENAAILSLTFVQGTSRIFAATSGSGLFESLDGGNTWIKLTTGFQSDYVTSVVIDPSNPGITLAATTSPGGGSSGLYRSANGGQTWQAISASAFGSSLINSIIASPTVSGRFLAGTTSGVFVSTDGGLTWTSSSQGLSVASITTLIVDPNNDQVVYAGAADQGLFVSRDGGQTWTSSAVPYVGMTISHLAIGPKSGEIFAGTLGHGLVFTLDFGATWEGGTDDSVITPVTLQVSIDPTDANRIYAATGGKGVLKSTDGGATWVASNQGLTSLYLLAIVVDPVDPQIIYVGTAGGGVFVSEDGAATWRPLNTGLANLTVTSLAIDANNHLILYAGTEGGGAYRNVRPDPQVIGSVIATQVGTDRVDFALQGGGVASVSLLEGDLLKVRVSPTGTFADLDSGALSPSGLTLPGATIVDTATATYLSTPKLSVIVRKAPFGIVVLRPDGTVISADQSPAITWDANLGLLVANKYANDDERYFGLGQRGGPLDRAGGSYVFRNTDNAGYGPFTQPLYSSFPFYYGEQNGKFYGIFVDAPAQPFFDLNSGDNGTITYAVQQDVLNYYVFAGPGPADVALQYAKLTGFAQLPPEWALGFQQSHYGYASWAEVQDIAKTFRDLKIPVDSVYLDLNYMNQLSPLTWDPVHFADPERNIQELLDMGIQTVNIVDPVVLHSDPLWETLDGFGFFLKDGSGKSIVAPVFLGDVSWIDFTNPEAAAWYVVQLKNFLKAGSNGVWNDINEPANNFMPQAIYDYGGQDRTDLQARNLYALVETSLTYQAMMEANPDQRPFILSRSGYSGIQRYVASWSGDTLSTFDSLSVSVQLSIQMSMSGILLYGHDIGGFLGSPSPELFIRWLEFDSFTPFFRNHSNITSHPREPWQFGQPYTDIARSVIEQRYKLLPYLYTLAEQQTQNATPLLQPLFFQFPNDPQTYTQNQEFMVGPNLMVAPVVTEGATTRTLYLPSGTQWYDFYSGQMYEGGQSVTVAAPLNRIPVMVRAGAIVPMGPVLQHVGQPVSPSMNVDIYPAANAEFTLYEDDGTSFAYRDGAYLRTRISSIQSGKFLTLAVSPVAGNYVVPARPWTLDFHAVASAPGSVIRDGIFLAQAATEAALDGMSQGWFYNAAIQLLVVKVQAATSNFNVVVNLQLLNPGSGTLGDELLVATPSASPSSSPVSAGTTTLAGPTLSNASPAPQSQAVMPIPRHSKALRYRRPLHRHRLRALGHNLAHELSDKPNLVSTTQHGNPSRPFWKVLST